VTGDARAADMIFRICIAVAEAAVR